MTDFRALLRALVEHRVEFLLVGGAAAAAHGSARLTQDLDVVYARSEANLDRIVASLADIRPYPRGAPPGLPFRWDAGTLRRGLNFTLRTSAGDIDLFGEIAGGGTFERLVGESVLIEVFGFPCRCLDLEPLIRTKRAAGRPRDLEAIAELEKLLELRREPPASGDC